MNAERIRKAVEDLREWLRCEVQPYQDHYEYEHGYDLTTKIMLLLDEPTEEPADVLRKIQKMFHGNWGEPKVLPEEADMAIEAAVKALVGCNHKLEVKPCANGDIGTRVEVINGGLVIFVKNQAMGHIDIKCCPVCGEVIREDG